MLIKGCPSGKETYLNAYNSLLSTTIQGDSSLEVNSLAVSAGYFCLVYSKLIRIIGLKITNS
jgi:hypothetical protein